jgi:hypothetical protein
MSYDTFEYVYPPQSPDIDWRTWKVRVEVRD